jgi:hypothetical protein
MRPSVIYSINGLESIGSREPGTLCSQMSYKLPVTGQRVTIGWLDMYHGTRRNL